MTDWKTVHGSQSEQPQEFDTTTSAFVVYQRRNIRKEKVRDANGVESDIWQYEERELTVDEYAIIRAEEQKELNNDFKGGINEASETALAGLMAVTDLYEELLNKGVL